jgi:hypothetical protein
VFNSSPASVQFFGFINNAPVTAPLYIRPQTGSATMVITDFEAFTVPEPGTLLLFGIGLAILGLARWKTRPAV